MGGVLFLFIVLGTKLNILIWYYMPFSGGEIPYVSHGMFFSSPFSLFSSFKTSISSNTQPCKLIHVNIFSFTDESLFHLFTGRWL